TGTVITTVNTDDANSTAQNIGFTFNYNGTAYTQFVLNTNGFIKLGSTAPSGTQLFLSETNTTLVDVFQSTSDPDIIAPLNTDLTAGTTGTAEYRVATTGTTGSRICTIQWKNVSDKVGTSPTQYTSLSFQVRLYEATGVIEFVYAAPTVGATSAVRFTQVGLKGSAFDFGQIVQVSKASMDAWSAATFSNYTDVDNSGFLNTLNIRSVAAPTAGRTFRFSPACTTANSTIATFPYTENFDALEITASPCGSQVLDANSDTYTWLNYNFASSSGDNALTYFYNDDNASIGANDWFFTPGLALRAGYRYQLQFKYAAGDSDYPESLEVKYGTLATPAGQTNTLFSNSNINNDMAFITTTAGGLASSSVQTITPAVTGTYYIGFHAISQPDRYVLLVDDIQVTETAILAVRNPVNNVFTAQVAPVPFGSTLNVTLNTLKAGPLHLTMRDALGRVLRQSTSTAPLGTSTVAVPEVANLAPGVYFLNVEQGGASQVIRVAHE
ncbi:MAG: T9SS type A sorting domain-containing protein, partial [Hymenobacter sp.]